MGRTQACSVSTVAWFFGERRVPQTAARVEQVSEWITMWWGFNVDTRRRIRKVWWKRLPFWQVTTPRWNQATGPISATICSVLEAGWKPSTPGFWQAPDASAGALFNKAQIVDSFSRGNANMEKSGWALGQCWLLPCLFLPCRCFACIFHMSFIHVLLSLFHVPHTTQQCPIFSVTIYRVRERPTLYNVFVCVCELLMRNAESNFFSGCCVGDIFRESHPGDCTPWHSQHSRDQENPYMRMTSRGLDGEAS